MFIQQKNSIAQLLAIDRWQSDEDNSSLKQKMQQFSKLSKQYFYHNNPPQKTTNNFSSAKRTVTNLTINNKTPMKRQFQTTKSNLLNPVTKNSRAFISHVSISSPSTKQKTKRNLSYQFNYLSNHNGNNGFDLGILTGRQKKSNDIQINDISQDHPNIGLPKIVINENNNKKRSPKVCKRIKNFEQKRRQNEPKQFFEKINNTHRNEQKYQSKLGIVRKKKNTQKIKQYQF